MKRLHFLFLFALFLSSCSSTQIEYSFVKGPITSYVYNKGGNGKTVQLSPNQILFLKSWLKNNITSYSSTYATYVPKLLFTGPTFSINVRETDIIINNSMGQFIATCSTNKIRSLYAGTVANKAIKQMGESTNVE